ncbi:hypothetical protein CYY_004763 [Polysphondylium violaceum]|uniref:EGF-like domain-containing protein n=1 Tax=Polysphondylium violaceum TaxID=133409 RepID=A0A8J4PWC8_9MYCE|nr:hypothetical protein CYY_004763 [Polysphondylium violaceum]
MKQKLSSCCIPTLLIGLSVTLVLASQCSNYYPFSSEAGDLNIYPGIGLDESLNQIYVIGKYNNSLNSPFGYPYVFSISTNSSNGNLTKQYPIKGEIPEGPGFTEYDRLYSYLEKYKYMYLRVNQRGSPQIGIYNPTTETFQPVWATRNIPLVIAFNQESTGIVFSDFGIYKLDKIPTTRDDQLDRVLLYQKQITNGISVQGTVIYISTMEGQFYRGTTLCRNCTQSNLIPLFQDPVAKSITGFLTSSSHMFYSSSLGIYSVPLNGSIDQRKTLVSEPVVSMVINKAGTIIYFTTSDAKIKSVNTTDGTITILYTNQKPVGQCECAVGFSLASDGSCTQCNGTTLWTSQGYPFCTKTIDGNKPEVCFQAWQCGYEPFSICDGKCTCLYGFYGPNCDQCDGQVAWSNGYPSCVPNPTISPLSK